MSTTLHIQNIFDALNFQGSGVNGHLKMKCMQLQNRVMALAVSNDIVVVSEDCPQSFCDYIAHLKGISNVLVLRYKVTDDLRGYVNSQVLFSELNKDQNAQLARELKPRLQPYMHSAHFYETAKKYKWHVEPEAWRTNVELGNVEKMNDKTTLYKECKEIGIPIPEYWVFSREELVSSIVTLMEKHSELFIRQSNSGGGLGNTVAKKCNNEYLLDAVSDQLLSLNEFSTYLQLFARSSLSEYFVVSKLLNLYASPGTLFYVTQDSVNIIAHTSQILNTKRMFTGFMYPIIDERVNGHFQTIEHYVMKLINPWRERGFRGYGNIDWMVTTEDEVFVAERNARQTAVVAPLEVLRNIKHGALSNLATITKDMLHLLDPQSFDDVIRKLTMQSLLYENPEDGGIIITIPPSQDFGANQLGIMSIHKNISKALEIYERALILLEKEHEISLFPLIES